MQEEEKLNKIHNFVQQGRLVDAISILSSLNDDLTKLQYAQLILPMLNMVNYNSLYIKFCADSIKIAESLNRKEEKALMLLYKAEALRHKVQIEVYDRQNIVLPEKWLGFSLERDKVEYELLDNNIKKLKLEIKENIKEAQEIMSKSKNNKFLSLAYMAMGSLMDSEIDLYSFENINIYKNRALLRFLFKFKLHRFYNYFCLSKKDKRKIKIKKRKMIEYFLNSIKYAQLINDESLQSYAYYNLSNKLRCMNEFWNSKKYLKKAEKLAVKIKDQFLLDKIKELNKRIDTKNESIGNYLNV